MSSTTIVDIHFRFLDNDLDEIEFPVLFKVCITPAFKIEKIIESGYSNLYMYFMGKSRFGKIYGWAGHRENGSEVSSPESILKDVIVDIKEVLRSIVLSFRGGKLKIFNKNHVIATLGRPNYPSNCYDVDINKLTQGNLKGFFKIHFNFHPVRGFKVEIILEDANRAVSRTNKYNKFWNSGSRVLISNLTSKIYKYAYFFTHF